MVSQKNNNSVVCNNPNCCVEQQTTTTNNSPTQQTDDKTSKCAMAEKCASACAAYGRVCPCAARAAGKKACDAITSLTENSLVFNKTPNVAHHFNCDDLIIGDLLGQGGFSEVHQVQLKNNNNVDDDENGTAATAAATVTTIDKNKVYAVKFLKRQVMVNQRCFELGASDLAVEAHFLATLQHDHIVHLHGLTAGAVESNVASGKECGFFIVVDRLTETLEHRIENTWRHQVDELNQAGGMLYHRSAEYKEKRLQLLQQRLEVAVDIASAVQYLHSLKIVFRDLKPDNIGFDESNVVKIFDFGLAKELKPTLETTQDGSRYKLTGNTGSRRYMAPEVALSQPYNLSVDVYSLGILLWEMCTLEKPFFGYSSNKHQRQVVLGGERPRMDTSSTSWWPVELQWLIKRCWSADMEERPTLEQIQSTLTEITSRQYSNHHHNHPSKGTRQISDPTTTTTSNGNHAPQQPASTTPTTGLALPKGGFAAMKKPDKPKKQSRTWGFAMRK